MFYVTYHFEIIFYNFKANYSLYQQKNRSSSNMQCDQFGNWRGILIAFCITSRMFVKSQWCNQDLELELFLLFNRANQRVFRPFRGLDGQLGGSRSPLVQKTHTHTHLYILNYIQIQNIFILYKIVDIHLKELVYEERVYSNYLIQFRT